MVQVILEPPIITNKNMKIDRQKIHNKYNGHCAYCGKEITIKQMQVDHIQAKWNTWSEAEINRRPGFVRGSDEECNLNPSCARCNKWKSTFSVEEFRREIQMQTERLRRDSSAYRMALDFNLVKEQDGVVIFYFETVNY